MSNLIEAHCSHCDWNGYCLDSDLGEACDDCGEYDVLRPVESDEWEWDDANQCEWDYDDEPYTEEELDR